MMFLAVLLRELGRLGVNNQASRREVYQRCRDVMGAERDRREDEDPIDVAFREQLLEWTIRCLEKDIRAGVDVFGEEYFPNDLAEAEQKLRDRARDARGRARALAREAPILDEVDRALVDSFIAQMASIDAPDGAEHSASRASVLKALVIRAMILVASDSRIAMLWIVLEPAFLISAVIMTYWLFGVRQVFNMDVAPFAVIGSVSWLLLRAASVRVGSALARSRALLTLPPVTPLDLALSEACMALWIYTAVLIVDLMLASFLGIGSVPDNLVGFLVIWVGLWMTATGMGLCMGYVFLLWPYSKRVTPVIWRALSLVSGVLFVSEQFPTDIQHMLLLNPLLNGLQLLRSAYFAGYHTETASETYFFAFAAIFMILGLMCERMVRPRLLPA